jgi:hypothetical protein
VTVRHVASMASGHTRDTLRSGRTRSGRDAPGEDGVDGQVNYGRSTAPRSSATILLHGFSTRWSKAIRPRPPRAAGGLPLQRRWLSTHHPADTPPTAVSPHQP